VFDGAKNLAQEPAAKKKAKDFDPLVYAINYLSYRQRTTKEVATALKKKGVGKAKSAEILAYLTKCGYLDDMRFAEAWINYRATVSLKGRIVTAKELRERGLSREITEKAINTWYNTDLEHQVLLVWLKKEKPDFTREEDPYKAKQKLRQKMLYRGFSMAAIGNLAWPDPDNLGDTLDNSWEVE